jgi:hypothetical protein
MIYLDTSVALAHLLAEDRRPPDSLWAQPLVSSRLLEHELWTRINARRLGSSHGDLVRQLLGRVSLLELLGEVLGRAREPFAGPVRTLDALHLASIAFLQQQGVRVSVASYDARMLAAAAALDVPLHPLT